MRYLLDDKNRLVVEYDRLGQRFRKVLDGRFKINSDNLLTYKVKTPIVDDDIPEEFRLDGRWSLTRDHDLKLTLATPDPVGGKSELLFRGEIVSAKGDVLIFGITTGSSDTVGSTYTITLSGAWQADKFNRLTFLIKNKTASRGELVFEAGWEIDRQFRIVYRYKKTVLKKRTKAARELILEGAWRLDESSRIVYNVAGELRDSSIVISASLAKVTSNRIVYKISVGAARKRPPESVSLNLSGVWRITKGLGLTFEAERGADGKISCSFGAEASLTKDDTVIFRLKDLAAGRKRGVVVEFNRRLLKGDGEAFVRFLKSREETSILVGAGFGW